MEEQSRFKKSLEKIRESPTYKKEAEKIEREENEYNVFSKWFRVVLHKVSSCFERDVLRDSKDVLWYRYRERNGNKAPNKR